MKNPAKFLRFANCLIFSYIYGMKNLTIFLTQDKNLWIATCAEIPEANGQGETRKEAVKSLREAIELLFKYRREEADKNFAGFSREILAV